MSVSAMLRLFLISTTALTVTTDLVPISDACMDGDDSCGVHLLQTATAKLSIQQGKSPSMYNATSVYNTTSLHNTNASDWCCAWGGTCTNKCKSGQLDWCHIEQENCLQCTGTVKLGTPPVDNCEPGCCAWDGADGIKSCGGLENGDWCHKAAPNCEGACGGTFVKHGVPGGAADSNCCAFPGKDNVMSCGGVGNDGTLWCHNSSDNCQSGCGGTFVKGGVPLS